MNIHCVSEILPTVSTLRAQAFLDEVCYVSIELMFLKGPDFKRQLNIPYI